MRNIGTRKCFGFTLLEIILVLVMLSIFSAMILPYYFSGAMSSYVPVQRLQVSNDLNYAMEKVIYDYSQITKSQSGINEFVNNFSSNYGSTFPECSASAEVFTIGNLTTSVMVTITSENNEKLYYILTVQE